jgi:NADPH-dependent 2,4-dienoyl-CoA reductase/sulfur reductase-like enzyme
VSERLTAEVVVVGAGPAGLAAASRASEAGARTILLDEAVRPGGQIWRHRREPPRVARSWIERVAGSGATVASETTVVDVPASHELLAEREGRSLRIGFERLVLATGARELFLPFPGWTLPGVVGAGGAQALLKSGASFRGLRVVVAGSGPLLLAVAATLAGAGARVIGIVEQAPLQRLFGFAAALARRPDKVMEGLGYALGLSFVRYRTGCWVRAAEGQGRIERVIVSDGHRERAWECDVLACGFGLVPNLELARLLGCETAADRVVLDDQQRTTVPDVFAAGELGGIAGVGHALVTGAIAGLGAAGRPVPRGLARRRKRERRFADRLDRAFALRAELRHLARPDTTVCRCEDIPLGRIDPSGGARQAKLLTRAGMGPCQGRVCGPALSFLYGFEAGTVRPPLVPVALSVLEDEG